MTCLSAEQQDIVHAAVDPGYRRLLLLVRAGAGTGKTTTLVAAVFAWLQANPGRRVVLVTFSRAATDELSARLAAARDRVTVTTFDALLRRLIRRADRKAEFIGTVADRRLLHDALRATYGADLPSQLPTGLRSGIAALHRAAETGTPLLDPYDALLATVRDAWTGAKRRESLYSPGDLRQWLLAHLDAVTDQVAGRGGLLVVDEAQDCERAEVAFLARAVQHPNIDRVLVAHDPNQNVNGFRGAVRNLHRDLDHADTPLAVFDLTLNHRSSQRIVAVCRELLTSQSLPPLVTADPDSDIGTAPRLVVADGPARMLTDLAAGLLAGPVTRHGALAAKPSHAARERLGLPEGFRPEQLLLVTRKNCDAETVVRALLDAGVAAIQHAARRNPFNSDMLALLWAWCAPTLATQNGGDDPTGSWALTTLVTSVASRYGGNARAVERREHLDRITSAIYDNAARGLTFTDARAACASFVDTLYDDPWLSSRLRADLADIVALLTRWQELDAQDAPTRVRVERLLRYFPHWRNPTVHAASTKGARRRGRHGWHPAARYLAAAPDGPGALDRHVRQMIALGGSHARARSLDEFRAWASALFGGPPVVVMTAHSAKGREADHVIVPFADEGTWPLDRSDNGIARLDEEDLADDESRIVYVAWSRARTTLTLLSTGEPTPYVDPRSSTWHVC